jgi:hypothetical protein
MKTIERVMRIMTHINIGATLGTGAWILVSGLQIVGGDFSTPAHPRAPALSQPQHHELRRPACCLVPAETMPPPSMRVHAAAPLQVARVDAAMP